MCEQEIGMLTHIFKTTVHFKDLAVHFRQDLT